MTIETLRKFDMAGSAAFAGRPKPRLAKSVSTYLAHVEGGHTLRDIAAVRGGHPSTILRAIRRVERLREDPLWDRAISALRTSFSAGDVAPQSVKESRVSQSLPSPQRRLTMTKADKAILRRLCEPESFLMVGQGAEKAGIFCRKNQFRRPLTLIDLDKATSFLKRDWIACFTKTAMIAKYEVTAVGRAALKRALAAEAPSEETGFAEAPSIFAGQHRSAGERRIANAKTGEIETIKVNLGESPLGWLARRKDANGAPLLAPEEVEAGERLREDFELAQIGPRVGQDWRRLLTPGDRPSGGGRIPSEGPMFARERVGKALEALGPGLSDAALRVCCFLEGLEATERRMGWSARSGKVVLKLALQRLVDHYGLRQKREAA